MLYKLAKLCAIMAVSSDAMRMKDANGACSRGNDPGCSANNAGTNKNHLRGKTKQERSAKLTKIQQLSTSMVPKPSARMVFLGVGGVLLIAYLIVTGVLFWSKTDDPDMSRCARLSIAMTFRCCCGQCEDNCLDYWFAPAGVDGEDHHDAP